MRNTIGSRHVVVVVVVDLLLLLLHFMRMQWHRSSSPSSLSFFPVYYKIVFAFASVISMVGSRHVVVVGLLPLLLLSDIGPFRIPGMADTAIVGR